MLTKNLKNKNILITGADGFIGSHLTEALFKFNCNLRVMTMYNSFNTWGWLDTIDKKVLKNIEVISGDIRDKKFVNNACKNIDYIFHLASLIAIPHSYNSPYAYLETNALGTLNLVESSLENNIKKIIHTSTSEVYGESSKIPINESELIKAKSPYSAMKIAADQIAYSYFSTYNLPVTILRPFNTFGPRQSCRAIIPTIITQLLNTKNKIKLGSLYPTRDFLYVTDTVDGFIKSLLSEKNIGEIINIGSGYEISIGNLVQMIQKIMKTKFLVTTDKDRIRPKPGEVFRLKADIKKAKKLLNWKPKYTGKDGLQKSLLITIKWFKDNKHLYKDDLYNQ
ncbi:MAG: NAD-dependent dehydratase [Gammaproteobacteria bacterium]|nr:NAD-dependent dehydratase [Gammaproteobacteria bacterium]|tara:strand:+ start:20418 stop:21431 length:1014 start_codon:yes stop_codon:yes gene_type:complete